MFISLRRPSKYTKYVQIMNTNPFVKGRLIAHAGGVIENRKYTNCVEALEHSRKYVDLIEFDVCKALDGFIVAHDGLESRYEFDGKFADITLEEFVKLKYLKIFHPMSVSDLISRLPESSANIILDIKSENSTDYRSALNIISILCDEHDVSNKVIIQVYNLDDISSAKEFGFKNTILALWKNYYDIRSKKCRDCVELYLSGVNQGFRALSLRYIYLQEDGVESCPDIVNYYFDQCPMIFIHGQGSEAEENLLQRGFGLYSHDPEKLIPFTMNL